MLEDMDSEDFTTATDCMLNKLSCVFMAGVLTYFFDKVIFIMELLCLI